jgi:hypothetical protein
MYREKHLQLSVPQSGKGWEPLSKTYDWMGEKKFLTVPLPVVLHYK